VRGVLGRIVGVFIGCFRKMRGVGWIDEIEIASAVELLGWNRGVSEICLQLSKFGSDRSSGDREPSSLFIRLQIF